MNKQFTPGPWKLKMPKPGKTMAKLSGSHWEKFAKVYVKIKTLSGLYESIDGVANARLIAAAPEMFDLLEKAADGDIRIDDIRELIHRITDPQQQSSTTPEGA